MIEILDRPFDKIAIDLLTECDTSNSGNKNILTIIDHIMGWPEAFPICDKSADTVVSTLINHYPPVHMCPRYILSDNGKEFKNHLLDQVLTQLGIGRIFSTPQSNGNWKFFISTRNQLWRSYVRRTHLTGINTSIRFLQVIGWHQTLPQQNHPSS